MLDKDDADRWVEAAPFKYKKLYEAGYSMGVYVDDDKTRKYVLYRVDGVSRNEFEPLHTFDSYDEFLLAVKLLVPGGL